MNSTKTGKPFSHLFKEFKDDGAKIKSTSKSSQLKSTNKLNIFELISSQFGASINICEVFYRQWPATQKRVWAASKAFLCSSLVFKFWYIQTVQFASLSHSYSLSSVYLAVSLSPSMISVSMSSLCLLYLCLVFEGK